MTYDEALKMFEIGIRDTECEVKKELYEIALEAIKKQIPKSVECNDGNDICPNCLYSFGERVVRTHIKHWVVPYCKMCGQALDWSEDE